MKPFNLLLLLACFFSLFSQAQTIPSYVPTNGLVGWWPFNGNANDESGNGNHGTVNGATLTTDRNGNVNSAYSFDGVNDDINTQNSASLSITSDITISAWILDNGDNPHSNNYHTILGKRNNNGYWSYNLSISLINGGTGQEYKKIISGRRNPPNSADYKFSDDSISTLIWQHIVVIVKTDTINFYINGNSAGYIVATGNVFTIPVIDQSVGLEIGAVNYSNEYFWGKLDDIAIYNRALTQQEITALYQAQTCSLSISSQPTNQSTTIGSPADFNIGITTNCNTTASYQWQTNLGFGWQTLQNAGQYTGVNTDHLEVSNIGTNNTNQQFRCIVNIGILSDTSQAASIHIINNNNTTNSGITHAIPYQAVVRDGNGNLLSNHPLKVRCTLHDSAASGNIIYQETHSISTNNLGLFTLQIGTGTPVVSSIDSINWALYKKFIQIEVDTTSQGSSYTDLGTQQLMAVPYALYAETAGNALNGPKGDKGDVGTQGPIGLTGAAGINGQNGMNGTDGVNSLIKSTVVPAGSNCANGGTKIETGLDVNKNGILDSIEIQSNQTQYICNGNNAANNGFTHWIGEYYGGGVVIDVWKDSNGTEHGTIMALNDIGSGNGSNWGPPIQTNDEYNGANNCNLALQYNPDPNSAIALCHNYNGGGYTDWYLPARYEMANGDLMPVSRTLKLIGGSSMLWSKYWTSTTQWAYPTSAYVNNVRQVLYYANNGSNNPTTSVMNGNFLQGDETITKSPVGGGRPLVRPVRRF